LPQPLALVNLSEIGAALPKAELEKSLEDLRQRVNQNLAAHERISTVVITPDTWTVDNAMITPTMKIRRGSIQTAYGEHLAAWHDHAASVLQAPKNAP
jgi:long-subunit acyl-CoA synthetase (AMP-forming)